MGVVVEVDGLSWNNVGNGLTLLIWTASYLPFANPDVELCIASSRCVTEYDWLKPLIYLRIVNLVFCRQNTGFG